MLIQFVRGLLIFAAGLTTSFGMENPHNTLVLGGTGRLGAEIVASLTTAGHPLTKPGPVSWPPAHETGPMFVAPRLMTAGPHRSRNRTHVRGPRRAKPDLVGKDRKGTIN